MAVPAPQRRSLSVIIRDRHRPLAVLTARQALEAIAGITDQTPPMEVGARLRVQLQFGDLAARIKKHSAWEGVKRSAYWCFFHQPNALLHEILQTYPLDDVERGFRRLDLLHLGHHKIFGKDGAANRALAVHLLQKTLAYNVPRDGVQAPLYGDRLARYAAKIMSNNIAEEEIGFGIRMGRGLDHVIFDGDYTLVDLLVQALRRWLEPDVARALADLNIYHFGNSGRETWTYAKRPRFSLIAAAVREAYEQFRCREPQAPVSAAILQREPLRYTGVVLGHRPFDLLAEAGVQYTDYLPADAVAMDRADGAVRLVSQRTVQALEKVLALSAQTPRDDYLRAVCSGLQAGGLISKIRLHAALPDAAGGLLVKGLREHRREELRHAFRFFDAVHIPDVVDWRRDLSGDRRCIRTAFGEMLWFLAADYLGFSPNLEQESDFWIPTRDLLRAWDAILGKLVITELPGRRLRYGARLSKSIFEVGGELNLLSRDLLLDVLQNHSNRRVRQHFANWTREHFPRRTFRTQWRDLFTPASGDAFAATAALTDATPDRQSLFYLGTAALATTPGLQTIAEQRGYWRLRDELLRQPGRWTLRMHKGLVKSDVFLPSHTENAVGLEGGLAVGSGCAVVMTRTLMEGRAVLIPVPTDGWKPLLSRHVADEFSVYCMADDDGADFLNEILLQAWSAGLNVNEVVKFIAPARLKYNLPSAAVIQLIEPPPRRSAKPLI